MIYHYSLKKRYELFSEIKFRLNIPSKNNLPLFSDVAFTSILETVSFVSDDVNICELICDMEGANKPFCPFGKLITHSRNGLQK